MARVLLLILVLISTAAPAYSQVLLPKERKTEISNEVANQFYQNCVAVPDPLMTADNQQAMCACMAAQLKTTLSQEEMDSLKEQGPLSEQAELKMQYFVFGACMEFPAQTVIYNKCMADKRLWPIIEDMKSVCGCKAIQQAKFIGISGPELLMELHQKNLERASAFNEPVRSIDDPLEAIMQSIPFRRNEREVLGACMASYDSNKPKQRK